MLIVNVQYKGHHESRKDKDFAQQDGVDWYDLLRCMHVALVQLNTAVFFKNTERWMVCYLYFRRHFCQAKTLNCKSCLGSISCSIF